MGGSILLTEHFCDCGLQPCLLKSYEGCEWLQLISQFSPSSPEFLLFSGFLQGGRYSTPDGRITIFACDLFDVTPEMVGKVDAVWDRGSFVALSFDTRPRYAALLKGLVGNSFR